MPIVVINEAVETVSVLVLDIAEHAECILYAPGCYVPFLDSSSRNDCIVENLLV